MDNTLSNVERDALAESIAEEDEARLLLDDIGFLRSRQPPWRTSQLFWHAVGHDLRSGVLVDGRRKLLAAAAVRFPSNDVFATGGWVRPAGGGWRPDHDGPVVLTVLVVDAVGFSTKNSPTQVDWQEAIVAVTDRALALAGIPGLLRREDRGDGYLALVDVGVRLDTIVADFARELGIALRAHNALRNEDGRVRLRVAVNQGVVVFGRTSFTSEAVIATNRLVDADQVRTALVDDPTADLAFVISDNVFRDTVAERFRGLDQANFERIEVRNKKYEGAGWLQVDGRRPAPVTAILPAVDTKPAGDTKPTTATARTSVAAASDSAEAMNENNENEEWDFFVSYAEPDEEWAVWVVGILEDAHYKVHASYLFAVPGAAGDLVVQTGMRKAKCTIALLTPAYLSSPYVEGQWSYAWRHDPNGVKRKLVPVRVEECQPDGFLQGITLIDLVGRDQPAAARYLVDEVRASLLGRRARSPGPPVYPGDRNKR